MATIDRIVWDSCTWIALIAKETKIPLKGGGFENREQMARSVLEAAKKGKIEIAVSTLCFAEVCGNSELRKAKAPDNVAEFFEHSFILPVSADRYVCEIARELMYRGYSKLKPPDAIHLATALVTPGVQQLHTFDDKLLDLNGLLEKTDGAKLTICRPDPGGPVAPLLKAMEQPDGKNEE